LLSGSHALMRATEGEAKNLGKKKRKKSTASVSGIHASLSGIHKRALLQKRKRDLLQTHASLSGIQAPMRARGKGKSIRETKERKRTWSLSGSMTQ
jgi:hypothetical protein